MKERPDLVDSLELLMDHMKEMEEEQSASKVQLYHKEEGNARVIADAKDRAGLRQKLDGCLHPLDTHEHPSDDIVNITGGKIAPPTDNVDNAIQIDETMLEGFEKTLPEGFYSSISKKVKTMAITSKPIPLGNAKVYDLNVIYTRVIALLSSDRSVVFKEVLAYELAPIPTAMFTEEGM